MLLYLLVCIAVSTPYASCMCNCIGRDLIVCSGNSDVAFLSRLSSCKSTATRLSLSGNIHESCGDNHAIIRGFSLTSISASTDICMICKLCSIGIKSNCPCEKRDDSVGSTPSIRFEMPHYPRVQSCEPYPSQRPPPTPCPTSTLVRCPVCPRCHPCKEPVICATPAPCPRCYPCKQTETCPTSVPVTCEPTRRCRPCPPPLILTPAPCLCDICPECSTIAPCTCPDCSKCDTDVPEITLPSITCPVEMTPNSIEKDPICPTLEPCPVIECPILEPCPVLEPYPVSECTTSEPDYEDSYRDCPTCECSSSIGTRTTDVPSQANDCHSRIYQSIIVCLVITIVVQTVALILSYLKYRRIGISSRFGQSSETSGDVEVASHERAAQMLQGQGQEQLGFVQQELHVPDNANIRLVDQNQGFVEVALD